MKPKQKVYEFLESLQWKRYSKSELQKKLQDFFNTTNTLNNGTCEDCKEIDYSFLFTNAKEHLVSNHFIYIEIYYLKMRQRNHFIVTGTELLDYVD